MIIENEYDRSKAGKYTVQKPFEFETAKRIRLQQELAANEDMENHENEQANGTKMKSSIASHKEHEPLCLEVERNFKLRASDEKPLDDKPRKLTHPISPNLQVDARQKLKVGSQGDNSETNS